MGRILIVDDDDAIRKLLSIYMRQEGHEVLESASGKGVVEQHVLHPFDLIVLDIIMPDKEGLETLTELRRCTPRPRVLAISGGGADLSLDFLQVAKMLGAMAVLRKPFARALFLDTCREILAQPQP